MSDWIVQEAEFQIIATETIRGITTTTTKKKDDLIKRIGDGTSGQEGRRSNQIKQGDGSSDETLSTVSNNKSQVALRTIPVILSNGKNKLVANALLYDGSTK